MGLWLYSSVGLVSIGEEVDMSSGHGAVHIHI
jgi:hypothetical protein